MQRLEACSTSTLAKFEDDTISTVNDDEVYDTFDLEEFRRDLARCPRVAFQTCSGENGVTALQYVLVLPCVTAQVMEEILAINPGAINQRKAKDGLNTFQWVGWLQNLHYLSPEILRILLERGGRQYIIEECGASNDCPLFDLLDDRGMHNGPIVILESSPHAEALVLVLNFMGREGWIRDEVKDFALERAIALEREGWGIFTLQLQQSEATVYCLLREMFRHVDLANTGLFHRYLQGYIQGREGYFQDQGKPHNAEDVGALSVDKLIFNSRRSQQ
jgi:hypothetical protein